jgi:hypothetical protein
MCNTDRLTLPERIERAVREWPQWSRAELRKMDEIVAEVLDHCANGTGNPFIRSFCNNVLVGKVAGLVRV